MNRRKCFDAIVNHREPERLLVDFGKHFGSFHRMAYDNLKEYLKAEIPIEAETRILDRMAQNVLLDEEICDGCQTCLDACPYDALVFNDKTDKAEKCNLCSHRIEQGLEPFCVICCEGQAIYFGDLNDPDSRVSKLIAAGDTYQLLTDEGTGPGVYYISPKEPRGL